MLSLYSMTQYVILDRGLSCYCRGAVTPANCGMHQWKNKQRAEGFLGLLVCLGFFRI